MLHLSCGVVDLDRQTLDTGHEIRKLTSKECDLLRYLLEAAPRAVSRTELLERVWGYRGDTLTRTVDTTMRRLRKKIELRPSDPDFLVTVHGRGYRFEQPTWGSHNFVGRAVELAALHKQMATGGRLLTLVGAGGIGKTTLAREFLATAAADKSWFADLTSARNLPAVVATLCEAVGVPVENETTAAGLGFLFGRLAQFRRPLVVLDNAEQAIEAITAVVKQGLADAPDAVFLVTSRRALELPEERVIQLVGLPEAQARHLLWMRADAVRPGFSQAAEVHVSNAIVARLGGVPLAIELAAGHAAITGPSQLLELIRTPAGSLGRVDRERNERHRSLRAALDWSWNLLEPVSRTALAQCAAFDSWFDIHDAALVVVLSETAQDADLATVLRELVACSLIERKEVAGDVRVRLPPLVREYALERVSSAVEHGAIDRHRTRYAALAHSCVGEVLTPDDLALLGRVQPDLGAALARTGSDHGRERMDLVRGLDEILRIRGPVDARLNLVAGLLADPTVNATDRSKLLRLKGEAWLALGSVPKAERLFRQAAALAETEEDSTDLALALGQLAVCEVRLGQREEGRATAHRAADLAAARLDAPVEARVRALLGVVLLESGDLPGAQQACEEALTLAHPEDGHLRANLHANLVNACMFQGRHNEAEDALERADYWAERLNSPLRAARLGTMRGYLAISRGDTKTAAAHYSQGCEQYRQLGRQWHEAVAMCNLALVHMEAGSLKAARECIEGAIELHRRLGNQRSIAVIRANQGILELLEGDPPTASKTLTRALDALRPITQREGGYCACFLALARWISGDRAGAASALEEARELLGKTPDDDGAALLQIAAEIQSRGYGKAKVKRRLWTGPDVRLARKVVARYRDERG